MFLLWMNQSLKNVIQSGKIIVKNQKWLFSFSTNFIKKGQGLSLNPILQDQIFAYFLWGASPPSNFGPNWARFFFIDSFGKL